MKYIILISLFLLSCNDDKTHFENVLKSLEKNYTIQNIPKKEILFCWNIKHPDFIKDSLEYKKGLNIFYKQRLPFIKYLLLNKSSSKKYNNWIFTKNPCSSNIESSDIISNSKGVLILIDNLIYQENKKIVINDYIDKIKFDSVKKIILEDEYKDFDQIKKDYIEYIQKIK